jgi:hypothetical protein
VRTEKLGLEPNRFAIVVDCPLPLAAPALDHSPIRERRGEYLSLTAGVDYPGKDRRSFVESPRAHGSDPCFHQIQGRLQPF